MCTNDQIAAMPAAQAAAGNGLNRRQFARLGATGAAAAFATSVPLGAAGAQDGAGLAERAVSFAAPGGTMDGVFIHPAGAKKHPGVILWPDIAGLRPAKLAMGRDLAAQGYAVLVANPYYRSVQGQQFADFDAWRSNNGFAAVRPWMAQNTPANVMETAASVVAWLDAQDAVDRGRGIGNQGYCMTGGWTIMAAAAVPGRIKAAASFHGGGLVGQDPLSPVNLLANMASDAGALIAIARNDDASDPAARPALIAAGSKVVARIEVQLFQADHGWTVPDSPVYEAGEAARAREALLALYSSVL